MKSAAQFVSSWVAATVPRLALLTGRGITVVQFVVQAVVGTMGTPATGNVALRLAVVLPLLFSP
jgi:hypothetical protein